MALKEKLKHGKKLEPDQQQVMDAFFDETHGRVCVSASAGTGKTTLLVEIISQIVVNQLGQYNPFENILAVTFNIEAARQIKSKVKERIEKYLGVSLPPTLLMSLENQAWIMTLDSFTRELLSEVSLDSGIMPSPVVPDEYDVTNLYQEIIEKIENSRKFTKEIACLSRVFPVEEYRGEKGWKEAVSSVMETARLYCLTVDELYKNARNSFYKQIYKGEKPVFSKKAINTIISDISVTKAPESDRLKESFYLNQEILEAFFTILHEFEIQYNDVTKAQGIIDHDDARFWVIKYSEEDDERHKIWRESQRKRFKYILVDEFQDTSFLQCRLLELFLGEQTKILFIGDPKQTIYQWRNAEPRIFIELLDRIPEYPNTQRTPDSFFHVSGFCKCTLQSNFRSHSDLIKVFNELFGEKGQVFTNPHNYFNNELPHPDLVPKINLVSYGQEPRQSYIHPIGTATTSSPDDTSEDIVHTLKGIRDGSVDLKIVKNNKWRSAELGDCAILIQSRGAHWSKLRDLLVENDIRYFVLAEKGFFKRPEISLIIDVLDWLGNPYNKDALIRILRSPIIGLSDSALRYLAMFDFRMEEALEKTDKPPIFSQHDQDLLQSLIFLRDDLRWTREGRKDKLISVLLKFSHLDVTLLALNEGKQCLANVWYLQDIITSWEEEELLSYEELLERLKWYRENPEVEDYKMAAMSDEKDTTSVKVATIHSTKGLQFPVVFLFYPFMELQYKGPGNQIYYIRDQGRFFILKQKCPRNRNEKEWEANLKPGSLGQVIQRFDRGRPCLFDEFWWDIYSEQWRVYYVGMTRAQFHLFHNIQAARVTTCWQHEFYESYTKPHSIIHSLMKPPLRGKPSSKPKPAVITFNNKQYEMIKECLADFVPSLLNPSHLYDLISCPRKYQYGILQEVGSGAHCDYLPYSYEKVQFGNDVHRALELVDFACPGNKPYQNFLKYLEEKDDDYKKRVEAAVFSFIELLKAEKLLGLRVRKEYEITHLTDTKPSIILRDKIDLIIDLGDSLYLIDYKTEYPMGAEPQDIFLRNHYKYQLAAYKTALEVSMHQTVKIASIAAYDTRRKSWKLIPLDGLPNIYEELQKLLPLTVSNNGLDKKVSPDCEKLCEYYQLCRKS